MRETADVRRRLEALETELARLKTLLADGLPDTSDAVSPPHEQAGAEPSASRRDLLRYGAVALGAAAAAGMAASPVEGADGGPVVIGGSNVGSSSTFLASTTTGFGFYVTANTANYGVLGLSAGIGIYGTTTSTSSNSAGVQGLSNAGTGQAPGVYGIASSPNAPGVYGFNSQGGNAVRAEVPATASVNAIAMYALNYSSYAGGSAGAGGFAIYGLSAKGHGLVGATAAAGAAALVGATNGVAGPTRPRSTGRSSSAGTSRWWAGPRARRCRIPTARIAGCIAWRAPRAGSRISVGGRWSAAKR